MAEVPICPKCGEPLPTVIIEEVRNSGPLRYVAIDTENCVLDVKDGRRYHLSCGLTEVM